MGNYSITPSSLRGSVAIPTSKSHTMRAILFGSLANGKSHIHHYLPAPDTNHMIQACKLLGAHINIKPKVLEIEGINGNITRVEDVIQAGNSGIILRFITAIAALSPTYIVITGDHSLRHQRPMGPMLEALNQLDVFAVSSRGDGFAPLIIKGAIKGGKATISGEDSQPVSSLLIACSMAEGPTELTVKNPGEKPWIMLTLSWLDRLGIRYKNENFEKYTIEGRSRFNAFEYTVPGDWSSAAFPIAAALVTNSCLTIENVDINDPQGDKEIVNALKEMGALFEINDKAKTLHVKSGSKLKGITIDVNPFIDAITILAVIACFAEGETRLINASIARTKECDRLHCITIELSNMGANIIELDDSLIIQGRTLRGSSLSSHGDHRMAMSLTVAALGAQGNSIIHNIDCVTKTFPNFAETFQSIGAKMEIVQE
jgi:3-phosphoshikimate 1-carboxyvinyltransferase